MSEPDHRDSMCTSSKEEGTGNKEQGEAEAG
jgi:hypothetical protein